MLSLARTTALFCVGASLGGSLGEASAAPPAGGLPGTYANHRGHQPRPLPSRKRDHRPTARSTRAYLRAIAHVIRRKGSRRDTLAGFSALAGDAAVLGLGEAAHGLHEFPALRNRVIAELVAHCGLRTVVLETGVLEARLADRYVGGDPKVTLRQALAAGFTHGMGPWKETAALLRWMRAYNRKHPQISRQRLRLLGKDLPRQGDTLSVPLEQVRQLLHAQRSPYLRHPRWKELWRLATKASALYGLVERAWTAVTGNTTVEPDALDSITSTGWEQLTAREQARLAAGLNRLIEHLIDASPHTDPSRGQRRKTEAASLHWALRLTRIAQQLVEDLQSRSAHPKDPFAAQAQELIDRAWAWDGRPGRAPRVAANRYIATGLDLSGNAALEHPDLKDYFAGRLSRERHLGENVLLAGALHGKALNYAHNGHLARDPASEGHFIAHGLGGRGKRSYLHQLASFGSALPSFSPADRLKPGYAERLVALLMGAPQRFPNKGLSALNRGLGERYLVVGGTFGSMRPRATEPSQTQAIEPSQTQATEPSQTQAERAPAGSVEALLGSTGHPRLLLDLRRTAAGKPHAPEFTLGRHGAYTMHSQQAYRPVDLGDFDAIYYLDTVSPGQHL